MIWKNFQFLLRFSDFERFEWYNFYNLCVRLKKEFGFILFSMSSFLYQVFVLIEWEINQIYLFDREICVIRLIVWLK